MELRPRSTNPEHRPIVIDEHTSDWEIVDVAVGAMIEARESGTPTGNVADDPMDATPNAFYEKPSLNSPYEYHAAIQA